jgi:exodeoxyribonuclease V alpha subunit
VVVEGDLVFVERLHTAEVDAAAHLHRLLDSPARPLTGIDVALDAFAARIGGPLAPAQRHAVEAAAKDKVVVITGGPGVGKTTIVRAILSVFERARLSVRLAAPTGRAAKRLAEATGREATTIHRLLEYDPRLRRFGRSAESPVDTDAIIVDEASMVDIMLADALLSATPPAARVVIVGDSDQLP